MFQSELKIRVRYAETDRMGFVYYGNYAIYFEVARVEALRQMGLTYKAIEDSGIILPVLEFKIKYFKPAFYDDELTIKTVIKEMPSSRIFFDYETFSSENVLLNMAQVTLVFVDAKTLKPTTAHKEFLEAMKKYW
jgi:acyl-CoA thioester hydrolase